MADGTVLGVGVKGGGAHHAIARGIFSFPSGPDSARTPSVMEIQLAARESRMPKRLALVGAWIWREGMADDRPSFATIGSATNPSNCQEMLHDPRTRSTPELVHADTYVFVRDDARRLETAGLG